jgi:hypothetical protein
METERIALSQRERGRLKVLLTPHPLTPPVILCEARDPASITPHRPPTRPIPLPQPNPFGQSCEQPSPTIHSGAAHPPRNLPEWGRRALHFDHACRLLIDGKPS